MQLPRHQRAQTHGILMSPRRMWMRVLAIAGLTALGFSYTVPIAQAVGKDPGPESLPALEVAVLSFPSFDENARGASEDKSRDTAKSQPAREPESSAPERSAPAPAP